MEKTSVELLRECCVGTKQKGSVGFIWMVSEIEIKKLKDIKKKKENLLQIFKTIFSPKLSAWFIFEIFFSSNFHWNHPKTKEPPSIKTQFKHVLTFWITSGVPKSFPPCKRNPQGCASFRDRRAVITCDMFSAIKRSEIECYCEIVYEQFQIIYVRAYHLCHFPVNILDENNCESILNWIEHKLKPTQCVAIHFSLPPTRDFFCGASANKLNEKTI